MSCFLKSADIPQIGNGIFGVAFGNNPDEVYVLYRATSSVSALIYRYSFPTFTNGQLVATIDPGELGLGTTGLLSLTSRDDGGVVAFVQSGNGLYTTAYEVGIGEIFSLSTANDFADVDQFVWSPMDGGGYWGINQGGQSEEPIGTLARVSNDGLSSEHMVWTEKAWSSLTVASDGSIWYLTDPSELFVTFDMTRMSPDYDVSMDTSTPIDDNLTLAVENGSVISANNSGSGYKWLTDMSTIPDLCGAELDVLANHLISVVRSWNPFSAVAFRSGAVYPNPYYVYYTEPTEAASASTWSAMWG